jgi:hypothetical protein
MQKVILLLAVFISLNINAIKAQSRFQTYSSIMKIVATSNNQNYEWENDDITVMLNYKTGEFQASLKNTDFIDYNHPQNFINDTSLLQINYTLKGIFPIRELINQQTESQLYKIELQLINEELNYHRTFLFDMTVTFPNPSGNSNYRVFILETSFYNSEYNLPAFKKFDGEINIKFAFNGYIVGL